MEYKKSIISYKEYLKFKNKVNEKYDWVQSIIVYIFPYPNKKLNEKYLPARFAYGKDYHLVIKEFLLEEAKKYKLKKYEVLVDVSFLDEKLCAALSNLGVIGKNTLFISNDYGSSVFIGEIVTDIALYENRKYKISSCINCDLCVKSCPNNALENGFDKNKCLSYLNQKASFDYKLYDKMNIYYGCDICQDVCPMNKKNIDYNLIFSKDEKALLDLKKLEEIGDYKEYSSDKTYNWIGYLKMLRNILVVKCNNSDLTIEEIEKYQKKYSNVEWFYNHLEYLKGRIKNG